MTLEELKRQYSEAFGDDSLKRFIAECFQRFMEDNGTNGNMAGKMFLQAVRDLRDILIREETESDDEARIRRMIEDAYQNKKKQMDIFSGKDTGLN